MLAIMKDENKINSKNIMVILLSLLNIGLIRSISLDI